MHDINQIIEAQLANDSAQKSEITSFRTAPFFLAALDPNGDLKLTEWQPGQELELPQPAAAYSHHRSNYEAA